MLQVLPAYYRETGWKVHKNKKCSRHGKKASSCPHDAHKHKHGDKHGDKHYDGKHDYDEHKVRAF